MIDHTLDQISQLKLAGLKAALLEQMEQPNHYADMSFEERLSYLIDREVLDRKNRKTKRMLRASKMKYKPIQHWKQAMNHFAILFEDRMIN